MRNREQRRRWSLTAGVLALSLGVVSCAVLDRERHSLIFRPPAHRYHTLTDAEREELALFQKTRVTSGPTAFAESVGGQPFQPFRYCHRHKTYHVPESIAAIGLAPVEFPATISSFMATVAVTGSYRWVSDRVSALWRLFVPAPPRRERDPPIPDAPRRK